MACSRRPARPWTPARRARAPRPQAPCVSRAGAAPAGVWEARPRPPGKAGTQSGHAQGRGTRAAPRLAGRSACGARLLEPGNRSRQRRSVRPASRQPGQGRRRGAAAHGHQLNMMDLELSPPGLPSQQVLPALGAPRWCWDADGGVRGPRRRLDSRSGLWRAGPEAAALARGRGREERRGPSGLRGQWARGLTAGPSA